MKTIRKYFAVFRATPIAFLAILTLMLLAALSGQWGTFFAFAAVLVAQHHIVMLKAQVKILKIVAGASVFAALGGLFE